MHFFNHLFLLYKTKSNKKQHRRQQQEQNTVFSMEINLQKCLPHVHKTPQGMFDGI